ncbi:MAG: hypothetical protein ACLT8H_01530 [Streptococcus parasanguinis]
MKIYYSKFVGVGYLVFCAVRILIHLAFLPLLGFERLFSNSIFTTLISAILLFLIAIYATIAGIKRLTSHQSRL